MAEVPSWLFCDLWHAQTQHVEIQCCLQPHNLSNKFNIHMCVTPTHRDRISLCFKLHYVRIITCIQAFITHENAIDNTSKSAVIKMDWMHYRMATFWWRPAGLYHYCDMGNWFWASQCDHFSYYDIIRPILKTPENDLLKHHIANGSCSKLKSFTFGIGLSGDSRVASRLASLTPIRWIDESKPVRQLMATTVRSYRLSFYA